MLGESIEHVCCSSCVRRGTIDGGRCLIGACLDALAQSFDGMLFLSMTTPDRHMIATSERSVVLPSAMQEPDFRMGPGQSV